MAWTCIAQIMPRYLRLERSPRRRAAPYRWSQGNKALRIGQHLLLRSRHVHRTTLHPAWRDKSPARKNKSRSLRRVRNLNPPSEFAIRGISRESLMANPLSERPFPPAPIRTTRRNVLLALPAV